MANIKEGTVPPKKKRGYGRMTLQISKSFRRIIKLNKSLITLSFPNLPLVNYLQYSRQYNILIVNH